MLHRHLIRGKSDGGRFSQRQFRLCRESLVKLAEDINGIAPEVSASEERKDIDVAILFEGPHVTVFGHSSKTGFTADGRLEAEQESVVVCVTYVLFPSFEEEISLGNDLPKLIVGERISKHEGKVPAGTIVTGHIEP